MHDNRCVSDDLLFSRQPACGIRKHNRTSEFSVALLVTAPDVQEFNASVVLYEYRCSEPQVVKMREGHISVVGSETQTAAALINSKLWPCLLNGLHQAKIKLQTRNWEQRGRAAVDGLYDFPNTQRPQDATRTTRN